MRRRVPEGVLGPAVDVQAPVDAGVLQRAGELQDLVRGAERVLGSGADEERAGDGGQSSGRAVGRPGWTTATARNGTPALARSSTMLPPAPYPRAASRSGSAPGSASRTSSAARPMARIRSGSAISGRTRASIASGSENHWPPWYSIARAA